MVLGKFLEAALPHLTTLQQVEIARLFRRGVEDAMSLMDDVVLPAEYHSALLQLTNSILAALGQSYRITLYRNQPAPHVRHRSCATCSNSRPAWRLSGSCQRSSAGQCGDVARHEQVDRYTNRLRARDEKKWTITSTAGRLPNFQPNSNLAKAVHKPNASMRKIIHQMESDVKLLCRPCHGL